MNESFIKMSRTFVKSKVDPGLELQKPLARNDLKIITYRCHGLDQSAEAWRLFWAQAFNKEANESINKHKQDHNPATQQQQKEKHTPPTVIEKIPDDS